MLEYAGPASEGDCMHTYELLEAERPLSHSVC